jgi:putative oxidoreductase
VNNDTGFQNNKILSSLSLLCMCLSLSSIVLHPVAIHIMPISARIFMILGLMLGILFNILMFRKFIAGFLFAVFFSLIASRIAALYDLYVISTPIIISTVIMIIHYGYNAVLNSKLALADYQLIFLRMYIGFDLIPHFTEKLFAGYTPRLADIHAFIQLGVPHAEFFVWLAGLCELGGAIALGLGLLTRLGSILTVLYLFIATLLGKHFGLGFIWASPGGGWEYPLMWMVIVLLFAISGANKFSLDFLLCQKFRLPKFVKALMGNQH